MTNPDQIPTDEATPSEEKAQAKLAHELDSLASRGGVTVRSERPFWLGPKAATRIEHDLGEVRGLMPLLAGKLFRLGFISQQSGDTSAVDYYPHQHNPIVALRVTLEKTTPGGVDDRAACPEPRIDQPGYQFYAERERYEGDPDQVRCWICTDDHLVTFTMSPEDALAWALAVHTLYETLTPDQVHANSIFLDPDAVGRPGVSTATFVG